LAQSCPAGRQKAEAGVGGAKRREQAEGQTEKIRAGKHQPKAEEQSTARQGGGRADCDGKDLGSSMKA
jgi:hypothetical protein